MKGAAGLDGTRSLSFDRYWADSLKKASMRRNTSFVMIFLCGKQEKVTRLRWKLRGYKFSQQCNQF